MTYQYYSNLGCAYLEHGETFRAYEAFRTSLRLLHGGIGRSGQQLTLLHSQSPKSVHETTSNSQPSNSTPRRRSNLLLRRRSIQSLPSIGAIPSRQSQDFQTTRDKMFHSGTCNHAGLAFQTRALPLLPSDRASFSDDPQREAQISSALVVYNLGLVHHVASRVDSQDTVGDELSSYQPHELLYKARALYVQSLRLVISAIEPYGGMTSGNATVDSLYMNLLNNLAIISIAYGSEDPQEPHRLYSRLILLALSIKCKSYDDEDSTTSAGNSTSNTHDVGSLMDNQVEAFLSNASTLGLYTPSHASAA